MVLAFGTRNQVLLRHHIVREPELCPAKLSLELTHVLVILSSRWPRRTKRTVSQLPSRNFAKPFPTSSAMRPPTNERIISSPRVFGKCFSKTPRRTKKTRWKTTNKISSLRRSYRTNPVRTQCPMLTLKPWRASPTTCVTFGVTSKLRVWTGSVARNTKNSSI